MTNRISAYQLQPRLGGTGLGPEERLIRVISHGPSVIDLLNGHLNVTRTGLFVTRMDNEARYDTREAAETTVDCERHAMFFGSLADHAASIRAESRTAVLNNSYLSCWFRVGEGAEIERLVMKFADNGECAVVLTSVRRWMSAWRPSCEPGGYFSELLAVKYLDYRSEAIGDSQELAMLSLVPELRFKDRELAWQREARLIIHPGSTHVVNPMQYPGNSELQPDYRAIAIDSTEFIERLFVLDASLFAEVESMDSFANFSGRVFRSTRKDVIDALCDLD